MFCIAFSSLTGFWGEGERLNKKITLSITARTIPNTLHVFDNS